MMNRGSSYNPGNQPTALSANFLPMTELPPQRLESSRLVLRAATPGDIDLYFRFNSDPNLMKFQTTSIPTPREWLEGQLQRVSDSFAGSPSVNPFFSWLIEVREQPNIPIGAVDMGILNPTTLIGGYFVDTTFQSKGYASEAWKTLLDWVPLNPRVQEIQAWCHPDNTRSSGLLMKCGFYFKHLTAESRTFRNAQPPHDSPLQVWGREPASGTSSIITKSSASIPPSSP